jgi:hypothetical protein
MATYTYDHDITDYGSTSTTSNIRTSPIVVPVEVVKNAKAPRVSDKRADASMKTSRYVRQPRYDYRLNRPFSPIQINPDEDGNFFGGKKRSRKARSTRRKRSRRKRTKRSSSRRYRGRKAR